MEETGTRSKLSYEQAEEIYKYYLDRRPNERGLNDFVWQFAPDKFRRGMEYSELLKIYRDVLYAAKNIINPPQKKQEKGLAAKVQLLREIPPKRGGVERLRLGLTFR